MMPEGNDQRPTETQADWLFRLLVESVRDHAIFLLDPHGHVMTWNIGAERIKGYTAEQIIGRHFSIFFPPQEIRRGKPEYTLRVAVADGRCEEEGWRVRQDGSYFWANVVITALFDAHGELVGFAKVTRDLTERKRAEEERSKLLAMERAARADAERPVEQLRAIQALTEAGFAHLKLDDLLDALIDGIGEILVVDSVAILLLDADRGSLVTRAARGFEGAAGPAGPIPLGRGFAGRIAAEQRPIILHHITRDDVLSEYVRETRLRSLLGVPMLVKGEIIGVLHVGTFYDRHFSQEDARFLQIVADRVALAIEHARLLEAERSARIEAEIAAARLRTQEDFLAMAAHELRTPMTAVKGAVQLL